MSWHWRTAWVLAAACLLTAAAPAPTLQQQNAVLLQRLQQGHGLDDATMRRIRTIFERSGYIGQGNPAISQHPQSPAQCRSQREQAGLADEEPEFARLCGGPHMAPLYDPLTQKPEQAKACIDQYEFPDLPCEYPVVWVRAREAAQICEAMGKRLCDAHEWEGACQGRVLAPDYRFDLSRGLPDNVAAGRMREAHNRSQAADKRWSYGPDYRNGVCATGSTQTAGCQGGGWQACGSNT
jgi:hypothetical protein